LSTRQLWERPQEVFGDRRPFPESNYRRCVGALGGALSDFGINDNFMKELAASIKAGNAALFVLMKNDDGGQGA
jgi:hypothetical protein